ncbi:MAG: hypothetical protein ABIM99_05185 [Candidatus Dojkabacteria bacterium]
MDDILGPKEANNRLREQMYEMMVGEDSPMFFGILNPGLFLTNISLREKILLHTLMDEKRRRPLSFSIIISNETLSNISDKKFPPIPKEIVPILVKHGMKNPFSSVDKEFVWSFLIKILDKSTIVVNIEKECEDEAGRQELARKKVAYHIIKSMIKSLNLKKDNYKDQKVLRLDNSIIYQSTILNFRKTGEVPDFFGLLFSSIDKRDEETFFTIEPMSDALFMQADIVNIIEKVFMEVFPDFVNKEA